MVVNGAYKLATSALDFTIEDNGAVQVDEATDVPLKVFIAGPIKYWWSTNEDGIRVWGSPLHVQYQEWRDAVRLAIVGTGFCATYSPHRAIQGAWHDDLQMVNDTAIMTSNVMVVLTPPHVPANGTEHEVDLAILSSVTVIYCPPGNESDIKALVEKLRRVKAVLDRWTVYDQGGIGSSASCAIAIALQETPREPTPFVYYEEREIN